MVNSILSEFASGDGWSEEYSEKALDLTESFIEENNIRNHRKRKYILGGALLYLSNNKTNNLYRPKTISEYLGDDYAPSKLTHFAHIIADQDGVNYERPTTRDFAYHYAKELNCHSKVFEVIDILYKDIGELPGKSNSASAAALVYLSSLLGGDKKTQSKLSKISGRSTVGIRNIYYDMIEETQHSIPREKIKK